MLQPWIKLRVGLHENPRVARMARSLSTRPEFAAWAGTGQNHDQPLRLLICGLLLRVWGIAREHGEYVGEDLILQGLDLADLSSLAGCPGFGEVMAEVGWAIKRPDPQAVILPNFAEHNVAKTPAERQRLYRWRQSRGASVTLEQNRTEDKNCASETDACAAIPQTGSTALAPVSDPVVMTFPCTVATKGKYKGLDTWPLTESKVNEYRTAFPDVNLQQQLLKARQWLIDNHRKTYTGMPAYLGRWLGTAQNESPKRGPGPGGRPSAADFLKQQSRSLFDQAGDLHAGDPNDE